MAVKKVKTGLRSKRLTSAPSGRLGLSHTLIFTSFGSLPVGDESEMYAIVFPVFDLANLQVPTAGSDTILTSHPAGARYSISVVYAENPEA